MTEETTYITPHVVGRGRDNDIEVVKAAHEGITALPVFRSEMDAIHFMADSGNTPDLGFRPLAVDHREVADLLSIMGIAHVALSEAWTGTGGVDVFTGENFVEMLASADRA